MRVDRRDRRRRQKPAAVRPAGIAKRAPRHTLRHSFATHLLDEVRISAHGYDEMAEDGILAKEAIAGLEAAAFKGAAGSRSGGMVR